MPRPASFGHFCLNVKLDCVDEQLIGRIVPELRESLVGLAFREVFQLSDERYVVAFENDDFRLLFISIEPREPRIFLIKRRLKDLKKELVNPSKFVVDLEKRLGGLTLNEIEKPPNERIVELNFRTAGGLIYLIAQLTGKSANLFLLDNERVIIAAARKPGSDEQSIGMTYSKPHREGSRDENRSQEPIPTDLGSISDLLDDELQIQNAQRAFDTLAAAARRKNNNELSKLRRLAKNLASDLADHGDAEKWKRFGDLLLTVGPDAERDGNHVIAADLFEESTPLIEIEVDANDSITDAAQKYFRKYAKARKAHTEIAARMDKVLAQIESVESFNAAIEKAINEKDIEFLQTAAGQSIQRVSSEKKNVVPRYPSGIRSFLSSDGFEILVGKKATDNDVLTFKVAHSRDTWMHAADYPGSHVVIRNANRKEIPHKTLIQAAQLAAFYSQGKKQPKAAVHYTEKKFVNKPKGSAPGLVRLASFKTILVEPIFPDVSQT